MPNGLRRPIEIQAKYFQAPHYWQGCRRIAHRLIASLISQLSADRDGLPLRNQRADNIGSWREVYRDILNDTELPLENRNMFLDRLQKEILGDRVSHRCEFDSRSLGGAEEKKHRAIRPLQRLDGLLMTKLIARCKGRWILSHLQADRG